MSKLLTYVLGSLFAVGIMFSQVTVAADASAAGGCAEKAVSKDGKPLAGAAKASFIKKCEKDAQAAIAADCAAKALSKDGKPLSGAAKASFIKKCEKDAAAAK